TTIYLEFQPYASQVLIFSKRVFGTVPEEPVISMPSPIDLSTGWRVRFGDNTEFVVMAQLQSWTDNEATRYFSGTATYEKEVNVSKDSLSSGIIAMLHFGEGKSVFEQALRSGMQIWFDPPVREAAVV